MGAHTCDSRGCSGSVAIGLSVRILTAMRPERLFFCCLCAVFLIFPVSLRADSFADNPDKHRFDIHTDDSTRLTEIESTLVSAGHDLSLMLGHEIGYRPSVYIESDLTSFERRIGGRFPDWGAAVAIPERGMMVIKSPLVFRLNRSLEELLGHELAHLWLGDRMGSVVVPRWFDEGLAMSVSSEWRWGDNLAMSEAAVFGGLIPLSEIEGVNQFDDEKARVAYAESYLAVGYFYESYGQEAVLLFLDSLAAGAGVDAALLVSTGSNYSDFNREFQLYLQERFNFATLILDTMYFWLALAIILIIGATLKYRRRREYYARWEKEEELHSTDFDYGDPDNAEEEDDEPWRG